MVGTLPATQLLWGPSGLTPATLPWLGGDLRSLGGKLPALGRESLPGAFRGRARQDLRPLGEHQPWCPGHARLRAGVGSGAGNYCSSAFVRSSVGEQHAFSRRCQTCLRSAYSSGEENAEFFWKVTEERYTVLLARNFAYWEQIIMFCYSVSFKIIIQAENPWQPLCEGRGQF